MENIAKLTSYGCYLDCDFETAKYPDDKIHIVGLLAEYVYDLEQRILHYDERYIKLWNEIETLRELVSKEFDQDQKISDLEAKLAESEGQLKEELEEKNGVKRALSACNRQNDEFANMIKKLVSENEELKHQLAEKEKELKAKETLNQIFKDNREAKISFAVEQLEKAKGRIQHNIVFVYCDDYLDVIEEIDNQINQLKDMK